MVRNSDIQMRWIDAWNDVYNIVPKGRDAPCMLPDWSIVNVDECLGWLQDSVYQGFTVRVEEGWVGHRRGVLAYRTNTETDPSTTSDPAT